MTHWEKCDDDEVWYSYTSNINAIGDNTLKVKSVEFIDPEQNATYNMAYMEWAIKSGGVYNDITIGVENEKELICYHGMTGDVTHNG